jgi:hypothetical protein
MQPRRGLLLCLHLYSSVLLLGAVISDAQAPVAPSTNKYLLNTSYYLIVDDDPCDVCNMERTLSCFLVGYGTTPSGRDDEL